VYGQYDITPNKTENKTRPKVDFKDDEYNEENIIVNHDN